MKNVIRGSFVLGVALLFVISLPMMSRAALPDLAICAPAVAPHIVFRTFASNDCTVGSSAITRPDSPTSLLATSV